MNIFQGFNISENQSAANNYLPKRYHLVVCLCGLMCLSSYGCQFQLQSIIYLLIICWFI